MFTGIIEQTGSILKIIKEGTNFHFWISSPFTKNLKIDQSISHNGVCLTVVEIEHDSYCVIAIEETLKRSNLGYLKENDTINLERCMAADGRFDGHLVQGHVDVTATCTSIQNKNGSWIFIFKISDQNNLPLIVEKGSVCINGISLTIASVNDNEFSVAIIPYTFDHTNFNTLKPGSIVNIEYDIIGKYISKIMSTR